MPNTAKTESQTASIKTPEQRDLDAVRKNVARFLQRNQMATKHLVMMIHD
jgi:hypothetical protein